MDLLNLVKDASLDQNRQVTIKADELTNQKDWGEVFFEPEVGCSYVIKFLPNIGDPKSSGDIVHRSYYKELPDPDRKGQKLRWIQKDQNDPVLTLFFNLNDLKKEGDQVAEAKIKKYCQRKQQACSKIQILSSPKKEDIGKIRLFRFQSWGDNATFANMITQKERPSQELIDNGVQKENIFNIFGSSVLNIICEEATFAGEKGRSFTKSSWLPKTRGANVTLPNGEVHEFSENDLDENKNYKEEVVKFVEEFVKKLTDPNISISRWFSHCDETYPDLTEDEKRYFTENKRKVNEIVEVIETKSLQEIANYGKADTPAKTENKGKDILKESIPEELQGMVDEDSATTTTPKNQNNSIVANESDDIEDLLNENNQDDLPF